MVEVATIASVVFAVGAGLYGSGYAVGYVVAVLKGFSADVTDDA